jgi:hypothetical protein
MRSYVLPGINEAQCERLKVHGVPFSNWANGILITGPDNLAEALHVLNATHTEVPTQYDDYFEVVLNYRTGEGDVVVAEEDEYFDTDRNQPVNDYPNDVPFENPDGDDPRPNQGNDPIWDADWHWNERSPKRKPRNKTKPAKETGPKSDDPAEIMARSRQNYIDACRIRLEEVRENSRELAVPALEKLRASEARFFAATRKTALVDAPDPASEEALRQRFASEMTQIRELQKVHHVRVVANGLLIFTDELRMTLPEPGQDGAAVRKIGRFLIWMRLSGNDAGAYWFNSTRRVQGARDSMNAPYVYSDGRPSCDEITTTMLELIARCELAAAVDMAIQYVETHNPENPLSEYADQWPPVKRAELIM